MLQYAKKHPIGTNAYLALALLLLTGQRQSDVVQFGRQHFKNGWLTFTQVKNRKTKPVTLSIPIMPWLQSAIDASPCDWCDRAGLSQCSAHGLRKAGACIAAENGATEKQLMAIFGWQTMKEAAHYTKMANQKRLAASAMPLLSLDQTANNSLPLLGPVEESGSKRGKKPRKIKA